MGRFVGLLTGTFDPVHLGHIAMAQAAMHSCALDEVWLLVNPQPAHKVGVLAYADRVTMCELAVRHNRSLQVYAGKFSSAVHTMQTFAALIGCFPLDQFVFITGMDTIAKLDTWKDYQAVVQNASFAVADRSGTSGAAIDDLRQRLGDLGSKLNLRVFAFADHTAASSKQIRDAVAWGKRPEELDPAVYEYIASKGLYH